MYVQIILYEHTITLIVIIIDGKLYTSFNGALEQWRHERFFKVVNPKLQTSITELTGPPVPTVRTKQLRIFANSHSELDMILALFCYDMENPTRRRVEDDMLRYQVEQYRKTRD